MLQAHDQGDCLGNCRICLKEKQIHQMKQKHNNISFHSIYQHDFPKKIKRKKKQNGHSLPHFSPSSHDYLALQSTYLQQYEPKNVSMIKFHPKDCITRGESPQPISTTYLQSFNSTKNIEVEEPFRSIDMPSGHLPFKGKSQYKSSFNYPTNQKVNLPIIHKQATIKGRSIGQFQTTQKKSYENLHNPQLAKKTQIIRPVNNLYNLNHLSSSYQTTYRNMFMSNSKQRQAKHDINDIGSIYKSPKGRKNI